MADTPSGNTAIRAPTGDLDIWVAIHEENGVRLVKTLREFGFDVPALRPELFQELGHVVRMGIPPVRLEILTSIDGVDFAVCYLRRSTEEVDGIPVDIISLEDLKTNKRAAGRNQDLNDLDHLP